MTPQERKGGVTLPGKVSNAKVPIFCLLEPIQNSASYVVCTDSLALRDRTASYDRNCRKQLKRLFRNSATCSSVRQRSQSLRPYADSSWRPQHL